VGEEDSGWHSKRAGPLNIGGEADHLVDLLHYNGTFLSLNRKLEGEKTHGGPRYVDKNYTLYQAI
jgi:hypothetical protein